MSEAEYSESGKFCAELDSGGERSDGVREAVRIEIGQCAVVGAALERMRVADFYYPYNAFKAVAMQLLGAGTITLGAPLSRGGRATELIGKYVVYYFSVLHERADGDSHKQDAIMRYGILIAVNMDEAVGIFVEACHDAQIDFVRGGVRDAVC